MIRRTLLVGIAASLALAVVLQWDAITTFDWRLSWALFAGSVALFSVGPLVGGTCFWLLLRDLAPDARFGPSLWVWERSFAARYIPSGAMTVAVRLVERERLGATRRQMLSATVYEQAVAAAAAATVSLAAFALSGATPPLAAVVVLGAVLVAAGIAGPVAALSARRGAAVPVVRARALAPAMFLSTAGWLVAGAAAWVFVDSLSAGAAPAFGFLLGAYAFAWLVGFVVPFAPSGLGVREATFVALLAPTVGAAPATALGVGLRLASLAGDFVAIGSIELGRLTSSRWRRMRDTRSVAWELP